MRLGWLHYTVGSQSGVEMVIRRSLEALLAADATLTVRLAGHAGPLIEDWPAMGPGRVTFSEIPEMRLGTWQETPPAQRPALAEKLRGRLAAELAGCDAVVVENASVGAHPAFNLAVAGLVASMPETRFVFRVHDLAFHRHTNFESVKEMAAQAGLNPARAVELICPDGLNAMHLVVNRTDAFTLYCLGLDPARIRYLPNAVDTGLEGGEKLAGRLRGEMERRGWARPGEKLLVYPVRAVPRKNITESLLLVRLLNLLASGQGGIPHAIQPDGPFRLIIALEPEEAKFSRYLDIIGEFIERSGFEARLGLGELVAPRHRVKQNDGGTESFGVAELYAASVAAVTTSVLEGFGYGYLEPWCAGRVVVGRWLPVIDDFVYAGMRMDHFYRRLAVDNRDFRMVGEPPRSVFTRVSNEFSEQGMTRRLEFVRELDGNNRLGHFLTENRWTVERMLEALVRPARLVTHNRERAFEVFSPRRLTPRLLAAIRGEPEPA